MPDGRTATVGQVGAAAPAGTHPTALPDGALALPGGARVVFSRTSDGDLAPGGPVGDARRRRVVDLPWTTLRQVHGRSVVVVTGPGAGSGEEADAAVTAVDGLAIAVLTADCAPVALASPEGVVGVAHAGWRGLAAGVLGAAIAAMRQLGAGTITAVLGPCIRAGCYEFGPTDLDVVAAALGDGVRSLTPAGTPALDLAAGVRTSLAAAGVADVVDVGACTACSPQLWSHRARSDTARQATVVWRR